MQQQQQPPSALPAMADPADPQAAAAQGRQKNRRRRALLALNVLALAVGGTAGPILSKLYFTHGGSRRWFQACLQTAGWPILLLLLLPLSASRAGHVPPRVLAFCCAAGAVTGLGNFLYISGVRYLPVSTSALLVASQLAFNAVFGFLIVRQKFTPYSINAVLLLTAGSVLLSFSANGDRAPGVTHGQYVAGFVMTVGAAALAGLGLPVLQLIYRTAKCQVTYALVVEMQIVMSTSATVFCTAGMLANGDFRAIHAEATSFRLGAVKYYLTVAWGAVAWQLLFIGVSGVIFLTSSLLCGVITAVIIPVAQILAVLIFHDKFSGEKGMAVALALWGFASYLYGEYRSSSAGIPVKHGLHSALPEHDDRQLGPSESTMNGLENFNY